MSEQNINMSWAEEVEQSQVEQYQGRRATKEKFRSDSRESSSGRKKSKPNRKRDNETNSKPPKKPLELEIDPDILQRRQKQIDYGKNTVGYHNYINEVPLDKRTKEHPRTPDKYAKYSRRSWDTLIKMWRKQLHSYDKDPTVTDCNSGEVSDDSEN